MTTIYRKYRPQKFSEVVGQNHIKQVLENEIKTGKIAHAFLFSGPRGTGKTTIARIFAKAMNCEFRKPGESEPCNECESCREITESRSIDVAEMDAATHTQVEKIRENIIENIHFAPARRKFKIFIIDEAHMLSDSSFNALLKTLEEPPEHAIFILATTEIHEILDTIISRCQCFDFKKINCNDIVCRLAGIAAREEIKVEKEALDLIARHSRGGLRDAEGLLGQIFSIAEEDKNKIITAANVDSFLPRSDFSLAQNFSLFLLKKDIISSLNLIRSVIGEEGVSAKRFFDDTIECLRKILINKIFGKDPDESYVLSNDVNLAAKNMLPGEIAKIIEVLSEKKQMAKQEVFKIDELPLELAAIEICSDAMPAVNFPKVLQSNEFKSASPEIQRPETTAGVPEKKEAVIPREAVCLTDGAQDEFIDKIRKNWYIIVNKTQEYNYSLPLLLNVGLPVRIEKGTLKVGFKHSLYKDRLNKDANQKILEKTLEEFLGERILVEGVIAEEEEMAAIQKITESADAGENNQPEFSRAAGETALSAEQIAEQMGGKIVG